MASEVIRKTVSPCEMEECRACRAKAQGERFEKCEGCNCHATKADVDGVPLCRACMGALLEEGAA